MDREEIWLEIRNIKDLPTLPGVATRILEVTSQSEAGAQELAQIVSNDVSVSAKVLKMANSAFFGFSHQITTIPQAVVVLGFSSVRSLALGVSVFETLNQSDASSAFDHEAFWIHAIGCASASRITAKAIGLRDAGTPFVAGLLHDLGKVILDTYFTTPYQEVIQKTEAENRSVADVEMELLNLTHAEVGGWLAFRWKFPDILVFPIEHHHTLNPEDETFLKETLVVHLANILTKRAGIGTVTEQPIPDPDELVGSHLRLSEESIGRITEELEGEKDRIDEFFGYLSA